MVGKGLDMKKNKEKTVEDSIQDFRNIVRWFQAFRRKIKQKKERKMKTSDLTINENADEINRRYNQTMMELARQRRKAKQKHAVKLERIELNKKLNRLLEFENFKSWKKNKRKKEDDSW